MLLKRIQEDALAARRARETEKATLLVTLSAEAAQEGKDKGNRESTDDEVLGVVRKFLKNLRLTLDALPADKTDARNRALFETSVVEAYLPKQASVEELQAFIAAKVAELPEKSPKATGVLMKALREKFNGNYDGAQASALVKAALA